MNFSDLGLSEEVLRAVADAGYTQPTPVQEQAVPYILMGRDVMASAQTGTGKTASFTLPMIDILAAGRAKARMPRSLILEPTRELAAQVADNFRIYGKHHKLSMALIIGGESLTDQTKVLDRGADVLIATPGRLLDMFGRGNLLLSDIKILVIDEADRMLDMGFIPDVERIVALTPKIRQTLLFSATLLPEIRRLAEAFLINPKMIEVAPPATPAALVTQGLVMVTHRDGRRPGAGHEEKREALRQIIRREAVKNALIFCNRKRDVGVLFRSLVRHGFNAAQLHGDMPQPQRTATLEKFRRGEVSLLVCSDVAARGLDIEDMSHVFNFDVPSHAEAYVHRIGRTGRAGREGRAFTIATAEDRKYLEAITRLIGKEIPRLSVAGGDAPPPPVAAETRSRQSRLPRGRRPDVGAPATAGRPAPAPAAARSSASAKNGGEVGSRRQEQPRGRAGHHGRRPAEKPVVGMGDHTPAFLLRTRKPEKSG